MEAIQQSLSSLRIHSSSSPLRAHPSSSSNRPFFSSSLSSRRSQLLSSSSLRTNPLSSTLPQTSFPGFSSGRRAVVVMRKSAAGGYAAALADIGRDRKVLELLNADVEKLGRFLEDKQIYGFLVSPVVKVENKKSVLKALAEEAKFQPYTLNLLNLIVDRKRTGILKELVKEFAVIYNEMTDTQVAIVTSAVKIDTSQLALIAKKIQSLSGAKNVRMKNVIDTSLIAGFVIRYGKDGSRLIDMSVKGQLDRIAQQIELAQKVAAY